MKKTIMLFIAKKMNCICKKLNHEINHFGYPIVVLTAPKAGINFKVNRKDPAFDRPIAALTKIYK